MNEQPCRIAIFGNHSCSNRGDCAIARGLIHWIYQSQPNSIVTLYTRFTESAKLFLGQDAKIERDPLDLYYNQRTGKLNLLWKVFLRRFLAFYLVTPLWKWFGLPKAHKAFVKELKNYDLFIQVGGSFFVDVYGISQFEGLLLARMADIPVVCCGHSVGPFRGRLYRYVARKAFESGAHWLLREEESLRKMEQAGLPTGQVTQSGDTAWLVPVDVEPPKVSGVDGHPIIAITVRQLAPFDRVLGLSQEAYEDEIAKIADGLVDRGYTVCFVSTCTGLESYWRDDRIVAHRVLRAMKSPDFGKVVMDEWSDLELGAFMGTCRLVIATRLHSAILSMRFGTPSVVLGYEHKSAGICQRMGVEECSYPLEQGLNASNVLKRADDVLQREDYYRTRIASAVQHEVNSMKHAQAVVMGPMLVPK